MPVRELRSVPPVDLALTLRLLQHGPGDPTTRLAPAEAWRATRTPEGPATLHLVRSGDSITAEAWGPGGDWALEHVPALLGLDDHPEALVPRHRIVRDLSRRLPGLRIGRTDAVLEALVPAILEQKVTGKEAGRILARLVRAFGEPAPGPPGLMLKPDPARLAETPYFAFHGLGLERRRAEVIRAACARAARLEATTRMAPSDARRVLSTIPGIGVWTSAEVTAVSHGDPDAVSVGDYHLPNLVAWALAGEPRGTDHRMLELLGPYRGQRGRVIRLLEAGAQGPPRFGPRMPARSIAGI